MANRVLTVTAKIKDAASAGLNRIQESLRKTGGEAKKTAVNFSEFNRVMFATSAYVGLFTKTFNKIGDALLEGSKFARVTDQYERVMGPKGDLFTAIAGFTDNSIDKVEALRAGIQLKSLGIANSTVEIARLIAMAGTAGKMAGKDSAEGIKEFTHFLKDGSLAQLESLNLLSTSNPQLKLQMALIEKMGGVMGGALTAQMKYAMGLRLLRAATAGQMKGNRDLYDVIFDLRQSFSLLKNEVGIFIGTAIAPLMDRVTKLADKFSSLLENIRLNKKEILFLAKAFAVGASAVATFMATFGTLRLIGIGLKALGISTMPLIIGVTTLISLFAALTYKINEGDTATERFVNKLRVFGAVMKGIWQLVSSYLGVQANMTKGIGQMDRDLFELLNKNGLFVFVQRTASVIGVLGKFAKGVFMQLKEWALELDDTFGKLSYKLAEIFGVGKKISVDLDATGNVIDEPLIKRISDKWLNANTKSANILKKAAAAILVAFTAYKVLGIGKGFLSNIPLLGRLFKDGSQKGKPTGTKSDPVHVVMDGQGGPTGFIKTMLKDMFLGKEIAGPVVKGGQALGRSGGLMSKAAQVGRSTVAGAWMTVAPLVTQSKTIATLLEVFSTLKGTVLGFISSIRSIELGALFRSLFARTWISLASRFVGIKDIITGVMAGFEGLSKGAAALRGFQIIHVVLAGLGLLTGVIQGVVENFSSFTGMFGAAYDYLRSIDYAQMFSDLYDSISSTFSAIATWVSDTFNQVYDVVSSALSAAFEPLKDFGNYIYAKLMEGFGIIAPFINAVLAPIGAAFDTLKGWVSIAAEALKAFYQKLTEIPIVGELVKAAVTSMTNPFGTFKDFGQSAVGALAAGADMFSDTMKNATAKNFLTQADTKGSLPFMPATSDERSDYAMRAIEQASGMERDRMARAYRQAQEGTSAGGKEITAEEFSRIFGIALDNSKVAKNTKEQVVETKNGIKQKNITTPRGGC